MEMELIDIGYFPKDQIWIVQESIARAGMGEPEIFKHFKHCTTELVNWESELRISTILSSVKAWNIQKSRIDFKISLQV